MKNHDVKLKMSISEEGELTSYPAKAMPTALITHNNHFVSDPTLPLNHRVCRELKLTQTPGLMLAVFLKASL